MPRSSTAESSGASTASGEQYEERPDYGCTLKLMLPKFSKGYTHKDFVQTLVPHVCRSEIENVGRGKYPNEWLVTLSSQSAAYKLLRKGVVTVQKKKCVIQPYEENKVCGRIHWLPADIPETQILVILQRFGDVLIMEKEKIGDDVMPIETTVRFFVMNLKENITKEMIPHFIKVAKTEGLLTIKGRHPMCFRCKGDHRKIECEQRNTKFDPKVASKKKEKQSKKLKSVAASVQTTANPNSRSGTAANSSQARARKEPKQSAAVPGASGNSSRSSVSAAALPKPSENVPAVDPSNLQNFVNFLGQTLAALNMNTNQAAGGTAAIGAAAAATTANDSTTDEAKKKKKKKKNKKKESYDVTAASSDTAAAPEPVPVPVPAPAVNQVTVKEKPVSVSPQVAVSVSVVGGVSPPVTTAASGDTVSQKKKKNKKKKKPSNSANI